MRSVRGIGIWTDESGASRNASVEIAVDGGRACVTIAAMDDAAESLPTGDRRIAYFLGRVQDRIRAAEYGSRPIVADPKPKDQKKRHG